MSKVSLSSGLLIRQRAEKSGKLRSLILGRDGDPLRRDMGISLRVRTSDEASSTHHPPITLVLFRSLFDGWLPHPCSAPTSSRVPGLPRPVHHRRVLCRVRLARERRVPLSQTQPPHFFTQLRRTQELVGRRRRRLAQTSDPSHPRLAQKGHPQGRGSRSRRERSGDVRDEGGGSHARREPHQQSNQVRAWNPGLQYVHEPGGAGEVKLACSRPELINLSLRFLAFAVMLSNLYVYQGVLLAITNDPESLPIASRLLSGEEEDSGHRGPAKAGELRNSLPLISTRVDGARFLFWWDDRPLQGHLSRGRKLALRN